MTHNTRNVAILLEDIIKILQDYVEDDEQRHQIYDELIHPLESAGIEDFEPFLGNDMVFDEVYFEHYPEMESVDKD